MADVICFRCGALCVSDGSAVGYGVDKDGNEICYGCCGVSDKEAMIQDGRITLYFNGSEVTNWPGSLRFKVGSKRESRNNWGVKRTDVWFGGPDSFVWWGVNVGDSHQLVRCKRTKQKGRTVLVEVVNMRTLVRVTYVGPTPEEAVIAAYAQSLGDWSTWQYREKYSSTVEYGKQFVYCGDWATRKWSSSKGDN